MTAIQSHNTVPTNHEIAAESDLERREILNAMRRILTNTPLKVPQGATTFAHLATEAGLKRHTLYQKHPDLKDRFEYLRDHAHKPSDREVALTEQIEDLKRQLKEAKRVSSEHHETATEWKGLAELLARATEVLQKEHDDQRLRADRLQARLDEAKKQAASGPSQEPNILRLPSRDQRRKKVTPPE